MLVGYHRNGRVNIQGQLLPSFDDAELPTDFQGLCRLKFIETGSVEVQSTSSILLFAILLKLVNACILLFHVSRCDLEIHPCFLLGQVLAAACDGGLWPKCVLKTRSMGGAV